MGKAKTFGGVGVIAGAAVLLLSKLLVNAGGQSFLKWILHTYIPVAAVTLALIMIVVGILLLVYG